jgi:hypothetical protein
LERSFETKTDGETRRSDSYMMIIINPFSSQCQPVPMHKHFSRSCCCVPSEWSVEKGKNSHRIQETNSRICSFVGGGRGPLSLGSLSLSFPQHKVSRQPQPMARLPSCRARKIGLHSTVLQYSSVRVSNDRILSYDEQGSSIFSLAPPQGRGKNTQRPCLLRLLLTQSRKTGRERASSWLKERNDIPSPVIIAAWVETWETTHAIESSW